MAQKQGISDFYRGDTQVYRITLKDKDGNPFDLTGCKIWFTMKTSPTLPDTDAVVQKEVTNHIDPINGITEVILEAQDTHDVSPGYYYYDFQLTTQDSKVKTLLAGKVKILPDITRGV